MKSDTALKLLNKFWADCSHSEYSSVPKTRRGIKQSKEEWSAAEREEEGDRGREGFFSDSERHC